MPDFYYTKDPASEHDARLVTVRLPEGEYVFETDAGVFSRDGLDPGSRLLIDAAPAFAGHALDLGCGWGPVGAILARRNPESDFLLADVNERAVGLAQRNLMRNGVRNARAASSDGFENVAGTFRFIFTNPPIRAGKSVIYRLFRESKSRLLPGGALYIVIRKQQGADSAFRELESIFGAAETVARGGGYHVIRAAREETV